MPLFFTSSLWDYSVPHNNLFELKLMTAVLD